MQENCDKNFNNHQSERLMSVFSDYQISSNRWRFTARVAADGAVFAAESSLAACRNMTAVTAYRAVTIYRASIASCRDSQ